MMSTTNVLNFRFVIGQERSLSGGRGFKFNPVGGTTGLPWGLVSQDRSMGLFWGSGTINPSLHKPNLLGIAQEQGEHHGVLLNLVEPLELHSAFSQLTYDPKRESITQVDLKTVRLLLNNWLVGLLEAGLIWGEPHTATECSQANWVFVEFQQCS
jgi:hypothetical protein